jgi:hypothetical protein
MECDPIHTKLRMVWKVVDVILNRAYAIFCRSYHPGTRHGEQQSEYGMEESWLIEWAKKIVMDFEKYRGYEVSKNLITEMMQELAKPVRVKRVAKTYWRNVFFSNFNFFKNIIFFYCFFFLRKKYHILMHFHF